MTITEIIDGLIEREGGYVDDADDAGGETCWGITKAVARANGYGGPMMTLPKELAKAIYMKQYVLAPGFDIVSKLSPAIAAELVDTGVNMGIGVAALFLQQSLNAMNNKGKLYRDLTLDGKTGPATIRAIGEFLAHRHEDGEKIMLRALNCLQGARYIQLCDKREENESFVYGWLKNRVAV